MKLAAKNDLKERQASRYKDGFQVTTYLHKGWKYHYPRFHALQSSDGQNLQAQRRYI